MNDKDIIKRQQAEIEKLTIQKNAFGAGMKVEARKNDDVRSEAIKEFAERVLSLFPSDKHFTTISRVAIRSIEKEMLGKEDEQ